MKLVESLRLKGISDDLFLQAMSKIEREKFVSVIMKPNAYKDIALPIGYGQTISQPFTIAVMTEALQIKTGDKALEIGTGSYCNAPLKHDECYKHQMFLCPKRPGSTVKPPSR